MSPSPPAQSKSVRSALIRNDPNATQCCPVNVRCCAGIHTPIFVQSCAIPISKAHLGEVPTHHSQSIPASSAAISPSRASATLDFQPRPLASIGRCKRQHVELQHVRRLTALEGRSWLRPGQVEQKSRTVGLDIRILLLHTLQELSIHSTLLLDRHLSTQPASTILVLHMRESRPTTLGYS